MFPIDLLADLPEPRRDEPPSLRADIADELADHLTCAYRREVLKDGDEPAAEQRVLDRFGDPKKLARRLWWQAMWSRIMGQRILWGLQWVLTLTAVCLAGLVLWQQSQILTEMNANRAADSHWRQNLSMTLNDLRSRLPAPAAEATDGLAESGGGAMGGAFPSGGMGTTMPGGIQGTPALIVKLVQGAEDGPPLTDAIQWMQLSGANVSVSGVPQVFPTSGPGMMPGGMPGGISMGGGQAYLSSANGAYLFGSLEPDRYQLKITLADGQTATRPVLIRDDKPQEITVVCPKPREKVPVLITTKPLPEDLLGSMESLQISLSELPIVVDRLEWTMAEQTTKEISVDPATGIVQAITEQLSNIIRNSVNLGTAPPADRVVFLATGPVGIRFSLIPKRNLSRGGFGVQEIFTYPEIRPDGQPEPPLVHTIQPGDATWQLELPDELLAQARERLQSLSEQPEQPAGAQPNLKAGSGLSRGRTRASSNEAALAAPLGDRCRLIVKLTSETKDGPVPEDAQVKLQDERGAEFAIRRGGAADVAANSPDESGVCVIGPFEPGRYRLVVSFPDGRHLEEKLPLMKPGEERTVEIVCPPPATKATVLITAPPVPEDLRGPGISWSADFVQQPISFEGHDWYLASDRERNVHLQFDPATGLLTRANGTDVSEDAPKDRLLIVTTGTYRLSYTWQRSKPLVVGISESISVRWPDEDHADDPQYQFTARPGENTWEIQVPDEFWDAARKKLVEASAAVRAREAGDARTPGDSPGAKTER